MNFMQAMNVVHNRIQQLEPANASNIIRYLMQKHSDLDMIRLAFSPDLVMRSMISCVNYELAKNSRYHKLRAFHNNAQFLNLDDSMTRSEFSSSSRMSRRSPSLPEFPVKVCHYFSKGYCKNGNYCSYYHGQISPERESFSQFFSSNNSLSDEEHVVSLGSLEKLEGEIIELLKSRRGSPISIASLPMMYQEKYNRTLQAEGYLTESQRNGKAGYSLTKLLARLKNTIRLIDRPHGQHAVILAEDASKYVEYTGERNEQGASLTSLRQIYLTFPAESSFSELDVSNYFSKSGPVEDVRIPCQQDRMFGFVTFVYIETAKHILAKGNPHYICGAKVLVKPYKEKSRSNNFKPSHDDIRYGSHSMPMRIGESSRQTRKQYIDEHERSISKSLPNSYTYFGSSSNDFNLTTYDEEQEEQERRLSYLLDYLYTDDNVMNIRTNYNDTNRRMYGESLESQALNLPESPFSSLWGQEISTVT